MFLNFRRNSVVNFVFSIGEQSRRDCNWISFRFPPDVMLAQLLLVLFGLVSPIKFQFGSPSIQRSTLFFGHPSPIVQARTQHIGAIWQHLTAISMCFPLLFLRLLRAGTRHGLPVWVFEDILSLPKRFSEMASRSYNGTILFFFLTFIQLGYQECLSLGPVYCLLLVVVCSRSIMIYFAIT